MELLMICFWLFYDKFLLTFRFFICLFFHFYLDCLTPEKYYKIETFFNGGLAPAPENTLQMLVSKSISVFCTTYLNTERLNYCARNTTNFLLFISFDIYVGFVKRV